jgi:hypothetical protein
LVLSSRVVRAGEAARRCGQQALVRCPCSQTLSYDPPPSLAASASIGERDDGHGGEGGEEGDGNDTVNGHGGNDKDDDGDGEDGRGVASSVGVERGAAVYGSDRGTVTGGIGSVEPVQTAPPLPWSDSPYVIDYNMWAILRERERESAASYGVTEFGIRLYWGYGCSCRIWQSSIF